MPDFISTNAAGEAEMAYAKTGGVPWHGLGNAVSDDMTPEEMVKAAGIDWTVSKRNLAYANGDNVWHAIPKQYAICRDDNNFMLSTAGEGFRPVQNIEAADFFTKFVKAGSMKMETAGALKGGQFIWALAKIDKTLEIAGKKDPVEGYMLLSQPHKLGHALILQTTAIRVVCWNTFSAALGGGLKGKAGAFRMPHNQTFNEGIKKKAEEALGLATEQLKEFEEAANLLAKTPAKDEQVVEFFEAIMRQPKVNAETGRTSKMITQLEEAYHTSPGSELESAKGTWWGAFNAVTFAYDHSFGRDRDFTMASAWLGSGANRKRKAMTLALEFCKDPEMTPVVAAKVKSKSKVKVPAAV